MDKKIVEEALDHADVVLKNYKDKLDTETSSNVSIADYTFEGSLETEVSTDIQVASLTWGLMSTNPPYVFAPHLCNEGTLLSEETLSSTLWASIPKVLKMPHLFWKSLVLGYTDTQFQTCDPARLYTGRIWTVGKKIEPKEETKSFILLRDMIDNPEDSQEFMNVTQAPLTFAVNPMQDVLEEKYQQKAQAEEEGDAAAANQAQVGINAIMKQTTAFTNDETFYTLYNTPDSHPLASRIIDLSTRFIYESFGGGEETLALAPTYYSPAAGWSYEKLTLDYNTKKITANNNTAIRERFYFTTTPRSKGDPRLQTDGGYMMHLKSQLTPKYHRDFVCACPTPQFTEDAEMTAAKSLNIEKTSHYNYYEKKYEEIIASPEVSHNILPDHNIFEMNKKWSRPYKEVVWNFDDNESLVNGSDFRAYYDYVTIGGIMDQWRWPHTSYKLPDYIPDQNYISSWANSYEKFPDLLTGETYWNKTKYDDLIFTARSTMESSLKDTSEGMKSRYPMYNHIRLKLPNSSPIKVNDPTDVQRWDYRTFTGEDDFLKSPIVDYAYMSRMLQLSEARHYQDTSIAYPLYSLEGLSLDQMLLQASQYGAAANATAISTGIYDSKEDAAYWKDGVNATWHTATPTKGGLTWDYDVTTTQTYDLDFLKFLINLARYGSRLYGYDFRTSKTISFGARTYLPLLTSNNSNVDRSLKFVETGGGKTAINNTLMLSLLENLKPALQRTRPYSQILNGQLAPSITLGFKVSKYLVDQEGNKPPHPVSTYYISNNNQIGDVENKYFDFFDTRVKYGEQYIYDIHALQFVVGTKYRFAKVRDVLKIVGQEDTPDAHWSMSVDVDSMPDFRITEVPYEMDIKLRIMDKPPLAPEVEPVPFKGVDNKLLWLIRPQLGTIKAVPVSILPEDTTLFNQQYEAQYGGVVGYDPSGEPLEFKGDDLTQRYQMFRLSSPPVSYKDFANAELITEITSDFSTSTSFQDSITPNHKYYYIFRSIDVHNNLSNPSPVYEMEMINDLGTVYLVTKLYDFPTPEKIGLKSMKRFLSIEPALSQAELNFDESGLVPNNEGVITTAGKSKDLKLGVAEQSLFGSKKRIKVRLTSKKTNRKIDFNMDFVLNTKETEESKYAESWQILPTSGGDDGQIEPLDPTSVCPDGQTWDNETGSCVDIASDEVEEECP